MADLVIGLILLVVLGAAAFYVYKARKSGHKCIGCPHAGSCGKSEGCGCGDNR